MAGTNTIVFDFMMQAIAPYTEKALLEAGL